ncbi:MAG: flagellar export protein FliJ [Eubacteriales bacterium]|jgi:flagellar FliJ protein|nr:flagellar export protein FliJ [Eubacteriales bacterium]MDD3198378.1 flagellar export protein FliJ [Eubacteriales bacterium]MDD3504232.1 flagellar export protein FliJ [Eubacteriales bacterium]MDD4683518.1 flagellar export protein FliJ [Eubacteriales bacterium]
MKKFEFTLETLLGIKEREEKDKQRELADANGRLTRAQSVLDALIEEEDTLRKDWQSSLTSGWVSPDYRQYDQYFNRLHELQDEQKEQIAQIEQERDLIQEKLVRIMNEIKSLLKMKAKQYEAYKKEVAREEEKAVDDMITFRLNPATEAGG